jgi:RNA polymerase sigma-70 factor (ECF subfamily)
MHELDWYWSDARELLVSAVPGARRRSGRGSESSVEMAMSRDPEVWRRAEDPVLVDATLAGQPEAFDELVTRHRRRVYQVCYRFGQGHEDASDLTQEVFLKAYRSLGSFKGESSFKTWIYRIAVNVGLTRVSRKAPDSTPIQAFHAATDPTADYEEALDRPRVAARVREAVERLPPKQRAAVVLRMLEGLTHEEAAQVLNCSVGTVKANVFHGLRRLRTLLGGE